MNKLRNILLLGALVVLVGGIVRGDLDEEQQGIYSQAFEELAGAEITEQNEERFIGLFRIILRLSDSLVAKKETLLKGIKEFWGMAVDNKLTEIREFFVEKLLDIEEDAEAFAESFQNVLGSLEEDTFKEKWRQACFLLAVKLKKGDIVRKLTFGLHIVPSDMIVKGRNGYSVWHYAVENDDLDMIDFFAEETSVKYNLKESLKGETKDNKYTPLLLAVDLGRENIVERLMELGRDVYKEEDVKQALELAVEKGLPGQKNFEITYFPIIIFLLKQLETSQAIENWQNTIKEKIESTEEEKLKGYQKLELKDFATSVASYSKFEKKVPVEEKPKSVEEESAWNRVFNYVRQFWSRLGR